MDILKKHSYQDDFESVVDYVLDVLVYCAKPKPKMINVNVVDKTRLTVFVLPPTFFETRRSSCTS